MNTLEKRLRKRATESEESIKKRLAAANDEIMRACEYDYKVVNADLDEAVETVYNIILNRRKEI
jgi:guanylate kinase